MRHKILKIYNSYDAEGKDKKKNAAGDCIPVCVHFFPAEYVVVRGSL